MDMSSLTRYAELHAKKKALEAKIKEYEAEMVELEADLLTVWQAEHVQKITIALKDYGKRTCYLDRQLWASATNADYVTACKKLKENGDEVLVKMVQERFNVQTMSAWVREQIGVQKAAGVLNPTLPAIFRMAWQEDNDPEAPLTVAEKFKIKVLKA